MDDLERLLADWGRDEAAERELLEFIRAIVRPATRIVAARWHALELAEDAEQEFWIWLLEREMQPLQEASHGHTAEDVKGFLWVVVARRAHRWFRRRSNQRDREQEAIAGHPVAASGPTEAEILAITAELESRLTVKQRQVLHKLLGDEPAATSVETEAAASAASRGKRLIRKEIQRLYCKVREMLRG